MKTLLTSLLISFLCLGNITPIQAQNSETLFQQGMMKEEGEGNLKAAIDIYNTIVNNVTADRMIRAKALLQVGICYEKLGNQNARKTYQKLISEYSDQKDIIAMGREKLKGLKRLSPILKKEGIVASQVWSPAQDTYGASPNGRYLNYIDWDNISLNIKDLQTGATRVISKKGTWTKPAQFPDKSIWSPDGKQIAYYWFEAKKSELHIVNIDGSNNRILATGAPGNGPWPVTWSRDGKNIIVYKSGRKKEAGEPLDQKFILVSTIDGTTRDLKHIKNLDFGGHIDMSPNGKFIVYTLDQHENTDAKDIYILSMDGSVDQQLVSGIANDSDPIWSPDGKEILFLSNRYGSNDLLRLKIENGKAKGVAEIVKSNLGAFSNLHGFTKDKELYYNSANSRSDIYTVNLDKDSGNDFMKPHKISILQEKTNRNPSWSSDGRYIFYYRWQNFRHDILGEQYHITIYDTKTGDAQNLNTNIYGGKNLGVATWSPNDKQLLFHGMIRKEFQYGFMSYNIDSKKITPILSKKNTTRSDFEWRFDSHHVFSNDGRSIFTISRDPKRIIKIDVNSKKETTIFIGKGEIMQFKLSNDNSKIAYGYLSDNRNELNIVSTSGGESKKILSADNGTTPYDYYWDKNDEFLYFLEGSWRNVKKIMRISTEGGTPEEFVNLKEVFPSGIITRVKIHPDGKHLVLALEVGKGEVWKLDGIFKE